MYQCIAEQTGCSSIERTVAYKFCVNVNRSLQHQRQHNQSQQQQHLHSPVSVAWFYRAVFFSSKFPLPQNGNLKLIPSLVTDMLTSAFRRVGSTTC